MGPGSVAQWRTDFFEGAVWTCPKEFRGGKPAIALYRAPSGKNKVLHAWCPEKLEEGEVNKIFPLTQDRFLISAKSLFTKGTQFSPFAVGREREGKLEIKELLEIDIGEKFFDGLLPKADLNIFKKLYLTGFLTGFVRGKEYLAFANRAVGRLILININNLKTRYIKVFPDHADKDAWGPKLFEIEYALLGIQPTGDGGFILATRSQEAMLKSREAEKISGANRIQLQTSGNTARDQEILKEKLRDPRRLDQLAAATNVGTIIYPEILWWNLDPETGKLARIVPNSGVPESIPQIERLRDFRFRTDYKNKIILD